MVSDEFLDFDELAEEVVFCASAVSAFYLDKCSANASVAAIRDEEVGSCNDGASASVEWDFGFNFYDVVFCDSKQFWVEENVLFKCFVPLERPSL